MRATGHQAMNFYGFWHQIGCVAWLLRLTAHDQSLGCDILEMAWTDAD